MRTAEERVTYIEDRKRPRDSRTERLWVHDEWSERQVFSVPVDALVFNADNRRFRAEKMWAEAQLGRPLDPENVPIDERSVESLLLDKSHYLDGDCIKGTPSNDAIALRNDWERRKQESPLWIRPDGTVRNGNRRLAMIKREQRDGGDVGLLRVDVVILREDEIDEPALLEMEQREQLTENFKVRYNDIDYLLALREAAENRDVDWYSSVSLGEVAGGLQSMVEKSKSEVLRDLYAIKYMDAFLEDSGQSGEYHRMLRTLERFRDIGRTMMRVEADYPLESDEVIQVLFAAVRSGTPHLEIREIRRMLREDRGRFDALAASITHLEEDWTPADSPLDTPDLTLFSEDDDSEELEGPGPDVSNYPKADVASAIQLAIDGFRSSQQSDLLQMLREVRNRLFVLDERDRLRREAEGAESAKIRAEIGSICEWAGSHRDLL